MTPKTERWLEDHVTALSKEKYFYRQIIKRGKNLRYCISKKDIYHIYDIVLNLKGNEHLAESKNEKINTKLHPKTIRTQATIKKVKSLKKKIRRLKDSLHRNLECLPEL
ncbi:hypothetical protein TNCV_236091 [Trichonephila clavipes]|nr:hypothetical protein TNCV_236091 [Trichonephila clavipes]